MNHIVYETYHPDKREYNNSKNWSRYGSGYSIKNNVDDNLGYYYPYHRNGGYIRYNPNAYTNINNAYPKRPVYTDHSAHPARSIYTIPIH